MTRLLGTRRRVRDRHATESPDGRRRDPRRRAHAGELHDGRAGRPRDDDDRRVQFSFIASDEPERLATIYREAPAVRTPRDPAPRGADAVRRLPHLRLHVAAAAPRHLPHPDVPRRRRQVRASTRRRRRCAHWDRLFFVNERRLRNFIAAGAIDADSPAIRLIGMPKVDCLVDGSLDRDDGARVARPRSGAPDRALRADLVARLVAERDGRGADRSGCAELPVNLIVKLHDRSRDLRDALFRRRRLGRRLEPLLRAPAAA